MLPRHSELSACSSTLARKSADTPLLETGEMRDSITHSVEGNEARVGASQQGSVPGDGHLEDSPGPFNDYARPQQNRLLCELSPASGLSPHVGKHRGCRRARRLRRGLDVHAADAVEGFAVRGQHAGGARCDPAQFYERMTVEFSSWPSGLARKAVGGLRMYQRRLPAMRTVEMPSTLKIMASRPAQRIPQGNHKILKPFI